jgi:hypothetical protein
MRVRLSLLFACLSTFAMGQPIAWSFTAVPGTNGEVYIELTATAEEGWHLYATVLPSDEGPIPTTFEFAPSVHYEKVDGLQEPEPKEEYDPNFGLMVRYHSGNPRFVQRIKATGPDDFVVEGQLEYMCCNDVTCLPPLKVPFSIPVSSSSPEFDR